MQPYPIATLFFAAFLLVQSSAVDFILRPNVPVCSAVISTFDPIKVEVQVPTIGSRVGSQFISMTLMNLKTQEVVKYHELQDGKTHRNNFYIEHNIIHNICFELVTQRPFNNDNFIFISFWAEEHFGQNIGQVKIPSELVGETNLRSIYQTSARMRGFIQISAERQKKERSVQDSLVNLSSHKSKRIISITVIECVVIVLSGVYQILALRKFLIDRNLY